LGRFPDYDNRKRGIKPAQTSAKRRKSMADNEADRYRRAAEQALQQLDWTIGYLHGIHKTKISAHLAKNRTHIERDLMREPAEPMPSEVTSET
jgi:hypothetical protein